MKKSIELNQEILRKKFIEIFNEYPKASSLTQMKDIAKDYDDVRELLDESLNVSIGIMEAIAKQELKDKKEIQQLIKEITNELNSKNYL